jgi:shikimate kinase
MQSSGRSPRRVILLVGPKGAGKSTLGHLIQEELDVRFVRVEPLFLAVRAELGASHSDFERCGFQAVVERLRDELRSHDTICFESTGASDLLESVIAKLAPVATVLPVKAQADPEQCLERVRTRDRSIHMPVLDDQVSTINARAMLCDLPWAATIDNRGPLDRDAVLATIRRLLEQTS